MGAGVGVRGKVGVVVVADPGWSGKKNVGLVECPGMFSAVGYN